MVKIPPIKMVMTGGWFIVVLPTLSWFLISPPDKGTLHDVNICYHRRSTEPNDFTINLVIKMMNKMDLTSQDCGLH
jgi:hypothetical protein